MLMLQPKLLSKKRKVKEKKKIVLTFFKREARIQHL